MQYYVDDIGINGGTFRIKISRNVLNAGTTMVEFQRARTLKLR